ncbi:glycine-rich domain-containing protein [Flavobacterium terrae]|uniref:Fibronectin type-III domain-containing protein n=1 Tax=Flavobacterium terrae TaxID=415425 RepID=A0A1M6DJ63_9FLAO|nr:T9SS sorting signal type C domain-containing protein [Flavobacterium terrae]SHI73171.1 hypothetical protein SAMN05444363_1478 [Flavobacterium terrae]
MKKNYSFVEQLFVAFTEKQHYKTSKSGNSLKKFNFLSFLFLILSITASSYSQTFTDNTANGNETWTVPAGVTSVTVQVWGAGGSGGGSDSNGYGGGGAGGGGYSTKTFSVSTGQTINYNIGAGGTATTIADGNPGGNTTLSHTNSSTSITANGGARGLKETDTAGGTGGTGGTATGGSTNITGQNGVNGESTGASGASGGNGGNGGNSTATGGAGVSNGDGNNGTIPGGGGGGGERGGGSTRSGGAGANGQVIITYAVSCSGTPTGGTVSVSPTTGAVSSAYVVSATGYTTGTGITYQWQYNTVSGWINQGSASGTYSNYNATALATAGTAVQWRLVVTCSGNSGNSGTGTFTTTSQQIVPTSGNNSVSCGTNVLLLDNGGAGNYNIDSNGYAVLNVAPTSESYITITGNYNTESGYDYIRIYTGSGTGGAQVTGSPFSGTGTINFTGAPGQTYTVQFTSDDIAQYSGFELQVTYNGPCTPPACGRPTVNAIETGSTTASASWTPSAFGSPTGYYYAISTSSTAPTYPGAAWTSTTATSATFSGLNSYTTYYVYVITNCGAIGSNVGSDPFTTQLGTSNVATGCPSADSGWQDPLNGTISYTTSPPTSTCISSSATTLAANYLPLGSTSSYSIEQIAYNPPSAFNGLANPVSVGIDDVWSPVITLPFNFCFWGNTYTQCRIGSNSIITFDPDAIALTGTNPSSGYAFSSNIPQSNDNILLKNSIFGVFHDIDPSKGGTVGWELKTLASGCRALVVAYNNVPLFGDNTKLYTGMMVLYENTNVIEVYIKSKPLDNTDGSPWNGNNAIVGIQNATGTQAAVPPGRNGLDADWTATNEAWRFTPVGDDYAPIVHWFQNSISAANEIGTGDTITVQPTTTTTYYSQVEYRFCNDGGLFYAQDNITVTVTGSKTWNGSVSSDWNTANNWTPSGVPTALDCVVIPTAPRNAIVSGANYNGLGHNLTVQNGGNLSIASPTAPNRTSLTITDVINVNNGGNFTVNNSANLIQINNVANTGNINMLRNAFVDHRDYVYWSSPVAGFNSADISTYSGNNNLYKWTPTVAGNGVGNFGNWFSGVETMVIGKGYIERGLNSAPLNSPTTFTATFTGVPNNGNITTPISRGTYNTIGLYTSPFSPTDATQDDDNWNLIGNPYPSSINAKTFLTANAANLDGFIKVWTHGIAPSTTASDPFYNNYGYNYDPADYLTYNLSGAQTQNGFDGYIGAGQSFITKMLHTSASTSANAVFNNAMRSNTYRNDQFYKNSDQKSNSNPEGRIWLDIVSSTASNSTLVAYVDGATNSKDQMYDAQVDLKANFSIYSLLDGYDRNVIQGRSLPFDQNDQVPLAVKLPTTGSYNIAIQGVDGLFSNQNQNIYLEDKQLNLIHDLRSAPYTFNGVQGENLDRFVLRYTNQTLSNNDFDYNNAVNIFADNSITIKSSLEKIKEVTVYDVLGKTLVTKTKVDNTEISITEVRPTTNVLIVKVKLENDAEVVKKVIY